MGDSGVYLIRHKGSGRKYVGSTNNLSRRRTEHFGMLRSGTHCNPKLQAAWAKYGEGDFEFIVVELVAVRALLAAEQLWIDAFDATNRGFNLLPQAGSTKGRPMSEEHRAKISAAKLGHRHSEATKQRIRERRAHQRVDWAGVRKTQAANVGRKRSDEFCATQTDRMRAYWAAKKMEIAHGSCS